MAIYSGFTHEMVIIHSYVSLPEGKSTILSQDNAEWLPHVGEIVDFSSILSHFPLLASGVLGASLIWINKYQK